ncbi:MAG: BMP family ABC transporter substrate-binding protein [Actinomycetaceae bacterium]|nr:BMP family ABC transporter substrate-binding protein [Actinomycetaceae bacterium]
MKRTKFAAILGVTALSLGACGSGNSSNSSGSDYTACLISDAGGWDDKSFNQSAKEGLDQAEKELGINVKTAESKTDSDFTRNVEGMVGENCNLIIGVGFKLNDAIASSAKENTDIDYALVDSSFEDQLDNERALVFNTHESAYLAGYAAAANSKTGKVGTFGGINLPTVTIFMDGFADGVARYNQDKGANVEVLGWDKEKQQGTFTETFDDKSKGTDAARELAEQGADVIMPVAGPVGLGAAAYAKQNGGIMIVGVDSDWYESAPEYKDIILTSVQKGIKVSVFETIKAGSEGKFDKTQYVGTLENDGVSLAPFHDFEAQLPEGLQAELDAIKQEIIDGKTVVESESAFKVKE